MTEMIRIPAESSPMTDPRNPDAPVSPETFVYYEIPRKAYELIRKRARLEAVGDVEEEMRGRDYFKEGADFVEYLRLREADQE